MNEWIDYYNKVNDFYKTKILDQGDEFKATSSNPLIIIQINNLVKFFHDTHGSNTIIKSHEMSMSSFYKEYSSNPIYSVTVTGDPDSGGMNVTVNTEGNNACSFNVNSTELKNLY